MTASDAASGVEMGADTQTQAQRSPAKRRKRGTYAKKVRLMTMDDLDGRALATQHVKEMRAAVIADITGGEGEDALSALQRAAADHAAMSSAMIRDASVRWLQGQAVDPGTIATLMNAFNRTAAILGWERRSADEGLTLEAYIAREYPRTETVDG